MDRCSQILTGLLSGIALAASPALAQDKAVQSPGRAYELGLGYVSDDAFLFGRYNGLQEQGPYLIGDIQDQGYSEDSRYWHARGTNLGLDSRYLRLEGGIQGSQQYYFEYDQLPNNRSDSASTPFLGIGSTSLRLPPGFDINTNLDGALQPFEIQTERKRLGVGGSFFPGRGWQLDIGFQHETRDGIDRIGGAIAGNRQGGGGHGPGGPGGGDHGTGGPGGGGSASNSSASNFSTTLHSANGDDHGGGGNGNGIISTFDATLMPEPIDYQTNMLDAGLHYAKGKSEFDVVYHLSIFENNKNTLSWENPFLTGRYGDQSLAADNQFHQLSLTGGYLLPYNSRLSGVFSLGHMTQDDDFQSYTVNPAIATSALPRNSLDGNVLLTMAQLKLVSKPLHKLRLSAEYRHDDRDNDTPVDTYDYVVADSYTGTPVENNPLSYKKNKLDLTANYRLTSSMSLRGGYRYDDMSREYGNTDGGKTSENTLIAKWKMRPHATLGLELYGELGNRDGSDYPVPPGENPALRNYYLADRERTLVGTSVDYLPTDSLSLAAKLEYRKNDYPDTLIGLTESSEPAYTLDASYQLHDNVTTYAYYTHEDMESTQGGSETGTTSPDWQAEFDDTVDTVGVGATVTDIRNKWDAGADLVYTRATGTIEMKNLVSPDRDSNYPDLKTALTSLKLWTQYRYRRDLAFKFSYWYQDYSADNWAVDNLQEDSVHNLLLLGEDTQDYDTHVFGLSFVYNLD